MNYESKYCTIINNALNTILLYIVDVNKVKMEKWWNCIVPWGLFEEGPTPASIQNVRYQQGLQHEISSTLSITIVMTCNFAFRLLIKCILNIHILILILYERLSSIFLSFLYICAKIKHFYFLLNIFIFSSRSVAGLLRTADCWEQQIKAWFNTSSNLM